MKEFFKSLFNKPKKQRIWELDFFRGVCLLGVVIIHTVFDLQENFKILLNTPAWFDFIQHYGGILFVILSGICITLGHHNIVRGLVVAASALVITAVTYFLFSKSLWIFFGVLHLLAFCMLTYSIYQKVPWPVILVLGIAFIALGFYFDTINVTNEYLFPLGLCTKHFSAGDYFPIFPNLGYFMIGVVLGKTVYKKKETLFKKVNTENPLIRGFSFVGRHSLFIYLAHQPVVYGICLLIKTIKN